MPGHHTIGHESLLLRTPAASEGERGHQSPEVARARGGQVSLTAQVVHGTDWGKYAPAITHWETVTGNPAPEPTQDGKLSAKFTEWMMGLKPGHITDVPGLKRAEQLKACGNGVVPQQAALAIRRLINDIT